MLEVIKPLLDEVERLRVAMGQHGAYLAKTEAATRYALIDPVLAMLGWSVHDAASVLAEYRSGAAVTKFADYALMANGQPATLIEAKAYSAKLALKELEQLSNYCVNCQPRPVRWGILTNGDRWQLVDAHKVAVPLQRRIVLDFQLSEGLAIVAVKHLVDLFGVVAGHVEASSAQAALSQPAPSILTPQQKPSVGGGQEFGLQSLLERAVAGGKPPSSILLGGVQAAPTKSWAAVLRETASWLAVGGKIARSHCPIADVGGKKRYLVNSEPRHADGAEFKSPYVLAGGLQLETNYSAANTVRNTAHLLSFAKVGVGALTWQP